MGPAGTLTGCGRVDLEALANVTVFLETLAFLALGLVALKCPALARASFASVPDVSAVWCASRLGLAACPAVASIWPTEGPVEGGTQVTVYGANFDASLGVVCSFGGISVAAAVVSPNALLCTSPQLPEGFSEFRVLQGAHEAASPSPSEFRLYNVTAFIEAGYANGSFQGPFEYELDPYAYRGVEPIRFQAYVSASAVSAWPPASTPGGLLSASGANFLNFLGEGAVCVFSGAGVGASGRGASRARVISTGLALCELHVPAEDVEPGGGPVPASVALLGAGAADEPAAAPLRGCTASGECNATTAPPANLTCGCSACTRVTPSLPSAPLALVRAPFLLHAFELFQLSPSSPTAAISGPRGGARLTITRVNVNAPPDKSDEFASSAAAGWCRFGGAVLARTQADGAGGLWCSTPPWRGAAGSAIQVDISLDGARFDSGPFSLTYLDALRVQGHDAQFRSATGEVPIRLAVRREPRRRGETPSCVEPAAGQPPPSFVSGLGEVSAASWVDGGCGLRGHVSSAAPDGFAAILVQEPFSPAFASRFVDLPIVNVPQRGAVLATSPMHPEQGQLWCQFGGARAAAAPVSPAAVNAVDFASNSAVRCSLPAGAEAGVAHVRLVESLSGELGAVDVPLHSPAAVLAALPRTLSAGDGKATGSLLLLAGRDMLPGTVSLIRLVPRFGPTAVLGAGYHARLLSSGAAVVEVASSAGAYAVQLSADGASFTSQDALVDIAGVPPVESSLCWRPTDGSGCEESDDGVCVWSTSFALGAPSDDVRLVKCIVEAGPEAAVPALVAPSRSTVYLNAPRITVVSSPGYSRSSFPFGNQSGMLPACIVDGIPTTSAGTTVDVSSNPGVVGVAISCLLSLGKPRAVIGFASVSVSAFVGSVVVELLEPPRLHSVEPAVGLPFSLVGVHGASFAGEVWLSVSTSAVLAPSPLRVLSTSFAVGELLSLRDRLASEISGGGLLDGAGRLQYFSDAPWTVASISVLRASTGGSVENSSTTAVAGGPLELNVAGGMLLEVSGVAGGAAPPLAAVHCIFVSSSRSAIVVMAQPEDPRSTPTVTCLQPARRPGTVLLLAGIGGSSAEFVTDAIVKDSIPQTTAISTTTSISTAAADATVLAATPVEGHVGLDSWVMLDARHWTAPTVHCSIPNANGGGRLSSRGRVLSTAAVFCEVLAGDYEAGVVSVRLAASMTTSSGDVTASSSSSLLFTWVQAPDLSPAGSAASGLGGSILSLTGRARPLAGSIGCIVGSKVVVAGWSDGCVLPARAALHDDVSVIVGGATNPSLVPTRISYLQPALAGRTTATPVAVSSSLVLPAEMDRDAGRSAVTIAGRTRRFVALALGGAAGPSATVAVTEPAFVSGVAPMAAGPFALVLFRGRNLGTIGERAVAFTHQDSMVLGLSMAAVASSALAFVELAPPTAGAAAAFGEDWLALDATGLLEPRTAGWKATELVIAGGVELGAEKANALSGARIVIRNGDSRALDNSTALPGAGALTTSLAETGGALVTASGPGFVASVQLVGVCTLPARPPGVEPIEVGAAGTALAADASSALLWYRGASQVVSSLTEVVPWAAPDADSVMQDDGARSAVAVHFAVDGFDAQGTRGSIHSSAVLSEEATSGAGLAARQEQGQLWCQFGGPRAAAVPVSPVAVNAVDFASKSALGAVDVPLHSPAAVLAALPRTLSAGGGEATGSLLLLAGRDMLPGTVSLIRLVPRFGATVALGAGYHVRLLSSGAAVVEVASSAGAYAVQLSADGASFTSQDALVDIAGVPPVESSLCWRPTDGSGCEESDDGVCVWSTSFALGGPSDDVRLVKCIVEAGPEAALPALVAPSRSTVYLNAPRITVVSSPGYSELSFPFGNQSGMLPACIVDGIPTTSAGTIVDVSSNPGVVGVAISCLLSLGEPRAVIGFASVSVSAFVGSVVVELLEPPRLHSVEPAVGLPFSLVGVHGASFAGEVWLSVSTSAVLALSPLRVLSTSFALGELLSLRDRLASEISGGGLLDGAGRLQYFSDAPWTVASISVLRASTGGSVENSSTTAVAGGPLELNVAGGMLLEVSGVAGGAAPPLAAVHCIFVSSSRSAIVVMAQPEDPRSTPTVTCLQPARRPGTVLLLAGIFGSSAEFVTDAIVKDSIPQTTAISTTTSISTAAADAAVLAATPVEGHLGLDSWVMLDARHWTAPTVHCSIPNANGGGRLSARGRVLSTAAVFCDVLAGDYEAGVVSVRLAASMTTSSGDVTASSSSSLLFTWVQAPDLSPAGSAASGLGGSILSLTGRARPLAGSIGCIVGSKVVVAGWSDGCVLPARAALHDDVSVIVGGATNPSLVPTRISYLQPALAGRTTATPVAVLSSLVLPAEMDRDAGRSAVTFVLSTSGSRAVCRGAMTRALFSCSIMGQPAGFVAVFVNVDGVQLLALLQVALREPAFVSGVAPMAAGPFALVLFRGRNLGTIGERAVAYTHQDSMVLGPSMAAVASSALAFVELAPPTAGAAAAFGEDWLALDATGLLEPRTAGWKATELVIAGGVELGAEKANALSGAGIAIRNGDRSALDNSSALPGAGALTTSLAETGGALVTASGPGSVASVQLVGVCTLSARPPGVEPIEVGAAGTALAADASSALLWYRGASQVVSSLTEVVPWAAPDADSVMQDDGARGAVAVHFAVDGFDAQGTRGSIHSSAVLSEEATSGAGLAARQEQGQLWCQFGGARAAAAPVSPAAVNAVDFVSNSAVRCSLPAGAEAGVAHVRLVESLSGELGAVDVPLHSPAAVLAALPRTLSAGGGKATGSLLLLSGRDMLPGTVSLIRLVPRFGATVALGAGYHVRLLSSGAAVVEVASSAGAYAVQLSADGASFTLQDALVDIAGVPPVESSLCWRPTDGSGCEESDDGVCVWSTSFALGAPSDDVRLVKCIVEAGPEAALPALVAPSRSTIYLNAPWITVVSSPGYSGSSFPFGNQSGMLPACIVDGIPTTSAGTTVDVSSNPGVVGVAISCLLSLGEPRAVIGFASVSVSAFVGSVVVELLEPPRLHSVEPAVGLPFSLVGVHGASFAGEVWLSVSTSAVLAPSPLRVLSTSFALGELLSLRDRLASEISGGGLLDGAGRLQYFSDAPWTVASISVLRASTGGSVENSSTMAVAVHCIFVSSSRSAIVVMAQPEDPRSTPTVTCLQPARRPGTVLLLAGIGGSSAEFVTDAIVKDSIPQTTAISTTTSISTAAADAAVLAATPVEGHVGLDSWVMLDARHWTAPTVHCSIPNANGGGRLSSRGRVLSTAAVFCEVLAGDYEAGVVSVRLAASMTTSSGDVTASSSSSLLFTWVQAPDLSPAGSAASGLGGSILSLTGRARPLAGSIGCIVGSTVVVAGWSDGCVLPARAALHDDVSVIVGGATNPSLVPTRISYLQPALAGRTTATPVAVSSSLVLPAEMDRDAGRSAVTIAGLARRFVALALGGAAGPSATVAVTEPAFVSGVAPMAAGPFSLVVFRGRNLGTIGERAVAYTHQDSMVLGPSMAAVASSALAFVELAPPTAGAAAAFGEDWLALDATGLLEPRTAGWKATELVIAGGVELGVEKANALSGAGIVIRNGDSSALDNSSALPGAGALTTSLAETGGALVTASGPGSVASVQLVGVCTLPARPPGVEPIEVGAAGTALAADASSALLWYRGASQVVSSLTEVVPWAAPDADSVMQDDGARGAVAVHFAVDGFDAPGTRGSIHSSVVLSEEATSGAGLAARQEQGQLWCQFGGARAAAVPVSPAAVNAVDFASKSALGAVDVPLHSPAAVLAALPRTLSAGGGEATGSLLLLAGRDMLPGTVSLIRLVPRFGATAALGAGYHARLLSSGAAVVEVASSAGAYAVQLSADGASFTSQDALVDIAGVPPVESSLCWRPTDGSGCEESDDGVCVWSTSFALGAPSDDVRLVKCIVEAGPEAFLPALVAPSRSTIYLNAPRITVVSSPGYSELSFPFGNQSGLLPACIVDGIPTTSAGTTVDVSSNPGVIGVAISCLLSLGEPRAVIGFASVSVSAFVGSVVVELLEPPRLHSVEPAVGLPFSLVGVHGASFAGEVWLSVSTSAVLAPSPLRVLSTSFAVGELLSLRDRLASEISGGGLLDGAGRLQYFSDAPWTVASISVLRASTGGSVENSSTTAVAGGPLELNFAGGMLLEVSGVAGGAAPPLAAVHCIFVSSSRSAIVVMAQPEDPRSTPTVTCLQPARRPGTVLLLAGIFGSSAEFVTDAIVKDSIPQTTAISTTTSISTAAADAAVLAATPVEGHLGLDSWVMLDARHWTAPTVHCSIPGANGGGRLSSRGRVLSTAAVFCEVLAGDYEAGVVSVRLAASMTTSSGDVTASSSSSLLFTWVQAPDLSPAGSAASGLGGSILSLTGRPRPLAGSIGCIVGSKVVVAGWSDGCVLPARAALHDDVSVIVGGATNPSLVPTRISYLQPALAGRTTATPVAVSSSLVLPAEMDRDAGRSAVTIAGLARRFVALALGGAAGPSATVAVTEPAFVSGVAPMAAGPFALVVFRGRNLGTIGERAVAYTHQDSMVLGPSMAAVASSALAFVELAPPTAGAAAAFGEDWLALDATGLLEPRTAGWKATELVIAGGVELGAEKANALSGAGIAIRNGDRSALDNSSALPGAGALTTSLAETGGALVTASGPGSVASVQLKTAVVALPFRVV
eukprot:tig00020816_g14187.t1